MPDTTVSAAMKRKNYLMPANKDELENIKNSISFFNLYRKHNHGDALVSVCFF